MKTLLYDRECPFCRTVVGALLMRDDSASIRPVALQEALAADLLPGMTEEDRFDSFHVVDDDQVVLSGADALPLLFAQLPHGRAPARAMRAAPGLLRALYGAVSANRKRIGPWVPDGWIRRADATIRRRREELGGDVVAQASDELAQATPA